MATTAIEIDGNDGVESAAAPASPTPHVSDGTEENEGAVKAQLKLIKNELKWFKKSNRASKMGSATDYAIELMIIGLMGAFLVPIAIDEWVGVNTTSWGSAESSLWSIGPIFLVLGILLFIVYKAKSR